MGDFDRPRRRRFTVIGAVLSVVIAAVGVAGWWLLRPSSPVTAPTGPATAAAPAWPATTPASRAATPPPDAGQGWVVPAAGAAGPRSVTDLGVPYGYTHDPDGAGLAAVNAVVAARYLGSTFPDPWAAVGFLADPRYADRGGNPAVEAFLTGPTPVTVIDPPGGTAAPATTAPTNTPAASATGGARVLGVRVTWDPAAPDTARAVVLWQRFSLQGGQDAAGRPGYTVVIEPVGLQLAWVTGDWKVGGVGVAPDVPATVVGTVPADYPVPAESWRR